VYLIGLQGYARGGLHIERWKTQEQRHCLGGACAQVAATNSSVAGGTEYRYVYIYMYVYIYVYVHICIYVCPTQVCFEFSCMSP